MWSQGAGLGEYMDSGAVDFKKFPFEKHLLTYISRNILNLKNHQDIIVSSNMSALSAIYVGLYYTQIGLTLRNVIRICDYFYC